MLFKFQQQIEKLMLDLFLRSGLSWSSPLRDIKLLKIITAPHYLVKLSGIFENQNFPSKQNIAKKKLQKD